MKGLNTGQLLAVVAIFALVGGVVYMSGMKLEFQAAPTGTGTGLGPGQPVATSAVCDMSSTVRPEIRVQLRNPLNSTGASYAVTTAYVYEGSVTDAAHYKGTLALGATGYQAQGSGFACACKQAYTVVVQATDGTYVSTSFPVVCDKNDNTYSGDLAKQGPLSFRVYDEVQKGFVYTSQEASAGSVWNLTGASFYSTTSNVTDTAIGTNGYYIYTVYTEVPPTTYSVSQYTDKELVLGINAGDTVNWAEPSTIVSPSGAATVTKRAAGCPTRISNDGYDWCYDVMSGGSPLNIKTSQVDLRLEEHANSGADPTEDVTLGLFTSGYFKNTANDGASMDFSKDDSSRTYVHTGQTLVLKFS